MAEGIAAQLPGDAVLAKDESIKDSGDFLISNIWIYLKLKLTVTNKRLVGQRPNTLLGFIPVGTENISYPLSNIAAVQTSTRVSMSYLILGLLFVLAGLGVGVDKGGWFLIVVGALLLLGSYQAQLNVQNSGGGTIRHRISVFNKSSAQAFAQKINTIIAERT